MSIEENKALARRWCEDFNTQNWAGIVAITAPDFVQHGAPPGIAADLAGHKQLRCRCVQLNGLAGAVCCRSGGGFFHTRGGIFLTRNQRAQNPILTDER